MGPARAKFFVWLIPIILVHLPTYEKIKNNTLIRFHYIQDRKLKANIAFGIARNRRNS
jgi:hypothetical protein